MVRGFEIAGIPIRNRYVLAPIAGYSDYAMRKVCADDGAGLVYTEMESCEALLHHSKATLDDLHATRKDKVTCPDTKLALQIFGGKKDSILASVPLFEKEADYDFLDFNCGCPVPKVLSQGAGSSWLQRPDDLVDMMAALVKVSNKPVVIKVRLGFDTFLDMPSLAKRLESVGVCAIAVHGRIRNEFFAGPVHYDLIRGMKEAVSIPIIANGGINETNFLEVFEETKADALMLGQRAIGYPKAFADMIAIEDGREPEVQSLGRQIAELEKHLHLIFESKEERRAAEIMRSISTQYIRGFDNVSHIRSLLVHCTSLQQYLDILKPFEGR